jgi:hypothetical protein
VFQSSKTLFFLGGMKTVFLELKMKVWWQLILISIWMGSMKWQKRNIYSQQVNSPRKNGFESCRNLWVLQSMSSWEITLNSSRTFLLILLPTSLKKNLSQEYLRSQRSHSSLSMNVWAQLVLPDYSRILERTQRNLEILLIQWAQSQY